VPYQSPQAELFASPQAADGKPMPDFRADVFDALMTRLEAFGDYSARLASTKEQKALAESFGGLVAEVYTAIRFIAEVTDQHGHPIASAKLQADNARLREALQGTLYALDPNMDGGGPSRKTAIANGRSVLAETDPSSTQTAGHLRRSSLLPPPGWSAAEQGQRQQGNEQTKDNGQDQGMSM
jgi:hypothetical protein